MYSNITTVTSSQTKKVTVVQKETVLIAKRLFGQPDGYRYMYDDILNNDHERFGPDNIL